MGYWIFKALLSPLFFVSWRVRVEGRQHVPAGGPAIVAANHQSFCDSFFLPLVLRRRLTYVAKAEYFDRWQTAWFFRAAGQIPMRRDGGSASQRALDTAADVLRSGNLLGIYPEGTRAPDVRLHRGHTGAARLSLAGGIPIIPVGIAGTREVQPPGSRFMRPFRTVTLRFGPPLSYTFDGTTVVAGGAGQPPGAAGTGETEPGVAASTAAMRELAPEELRALTDALMAEIARLSGQEYVDTYATRTRRT